MAIGCHGSNCSSVCQGRCHDDGCDRSTGECFRCRSGFYGRHCDTPCPPRCSSFPVGGVVYCDRHTGACSESCGGGWTGVHCDGRCPPNCKGLSSVCHIRTGECLDGCDGRWAGNFCNMTCDNCLMGRCSITGYCLHGCQAGFYGQNCEVRCQHCWISGCERQTGVCEQCQPGYHGHRCRETCPEKCYKGRDGHKHCDRHTAVCQEGCETGWHGLHCNTHCSASCKSSLCYSHDGSCLEGCVPGYYGKHCHKKCLHCRDNVCDHHGRCSACTDGCDEACGWCLDGVCEVDGSCSRGCKDGAYGSRCQYTCSGDCVACDQMTGDCNDVGSVDAVIELDTIASTCSLMYSKYQNVMPIAFVLACLSNYLDI
ncbi:scavenger receptor class F member 2-like [Haliotis rubra]|uniref:scavenger receptor class F member 2-like n=1 Tax=Haliotis rubra TaxID=36100 RepID=UPI001EE53790|nr:scavenger receptor class F member 2-like [Haliotis rubra]